MIKYSITPNQIDILKASAAAVLPVYSDIGWQDISIQFAKSLWKIYKTIPYGDSAAAKAIRKKILKEISRFIHNENIESKLIRDFIEAISNCNYTQKLQLLFSLADSPKFLLYSEDDLHKFARNIKDYQNDINAITYYDSNGKRICPYSPLAEHDDFDFEITIQKQKKYIKEFLLESAADKFEYDYFDINFDNKVNKALEYLNILPSRIEDYSKNLYTPTALEKGFFDSILYIRDHIEFTTNKMDTYVEGWATQDLFSLSESKATISDNETVMRLLHKLGWNKSTCPMVLSNLFYSSGLRDLKIAKQPGQIEVEQKLYFSPAPGLGPGYKVRWVYNTDVNVNNYLTPLANLIQEADKKFDQNEAYNDQLTFLLSNLKKIIDAFCADSTGYSDYLFRAIYVILLKLYNMREDHIYRILSIFKLPVDIAGDLIAAEFGTYQGCKLVVFIMNHANRLIGLISEYISNSKHILIRPNAGDDVVTASLTGKFNQSDLLDEIIVFSMFNCPINSSKSAWLQRDGYFDFCSKYFARNESGLLQCVSGVPAKKYGKEIVCIADFAETFKVLSVSGQDHTVCADAFEKILPMIQTSLEEGCHLPNIYNERITLNQKISRAKQISYMYGGLAEDWEERDMTELLNTLRYKAQLLLQSYVFNPVGVFKILNCMPELKETELFKALGSVSRQSVGDLIRVIKLINSDDPLDYRDLEWVKETIAKLERNAINGQSVSNSSSTYHRIERKRDADLLFEVDGTTLNLPVPKDMLSATVMVAILSDQKYVDIDNIRRYIKFMSQIDQYSGVVERYHGIGNDTYFAIRDPETDKLIRIYDNDDTRYENFEPIWECKDENIKSLVQLLRDCNATYYFNLVYNTVSLTKELRARRIADKISEMSKLRGEKTARKVVRKLVERILR